MTSSQTCAPSFQVQAECRICGRTAICERHHIIHGSGNRKQCETGESLVPLCVDCHRRLHGCNGHVLDVKLKAELQHTYFGQGRSEAEVRRLMGGKLILGEDGEIIV